MPPPSIKTVREIIYYQYAKIVSESAGFGKANYGMIMSRVNKLKSGEINWSSAAREWQKEFEKPNECIYCGDVTGLTVEHILPRNCGGEDILENVVRVCKSCNSSKGGKRLYEWRGLKAKDKHHRIAEGKYLKYLYKLHERNGTLDIDNIKDLCEICNLSKRCAHEGHAGELTVFCIEGCFHNRK